MEHSTANPRRLKLTQTHNEMHCGEENAVPEKCSEFCIIDAHTYKDSFSSRYFGVESHLNHVSPIANYNALAARKVEIRNSRLVSGDETERVICVAVNSRNSTHKQFLETQKYIPPPRFWHFGPQSTFRDHLLVLVLCCKLDTGLKANLALENYSKSHHRRISLRL